MQRKDFPFAKTPVWVLAASILAAALSFFIVVPARPQNGEVSFSTGNM